MKKRLMISDSEYLSELGKYIYADIYLELNPDFEEELEHGGLNDDERKLCLKIINRKNSSEIYKRGFDNIQLDLLIDFFEKALLKNHDKMYGDCDIFEKQLIICHSTELSCGSVFAKMFGWNYAQIYLEFDCSNSNDWGRLKFSLKSKKNAYTICSNYFDENELIPMIEFLKKGKVMPKPKAKRGPKIRKKGAKTKKPKVIF